MACGGPAGRQVSATGRRFPFATPTQAQQVRAVAFEYDALRFHQPLETHLLLQPLDVFIRMHAMNQASFKTRQVTTMS